MISQKLENKHSYILARKFLVEYYPETNTLHVEIQGNIEKTDLTSFFVQLLRHIKIKSNFINLLMDFNRSTAKINHRELKELNISILM